MIWVLAFLPYSNSIFLGISRVSEFMFSLLFVVLFLLCSIFFSVPCAQFLYMKRQSAIPWKLNINKTFNPSVSILIPMHNEERNIKFKLENLYKIDYPKDKIQLIFINDASTDDTLEKLSTMIEHCGNSNIKILNNTERMGKSAALNHALKYVTSDIVIVSDADCFWPSDILQLALPYLSDPSVGAITGRELLLNSSQSWVTKSEASYDNFVHTIRLGESKIHSTIIFQGGFAAYKKECLKEFDCENDDSGTALGIVQNNYRTLVIPEVIFYTVFPTRWKNKIKIKIRRATQLLRIWIKCSRLTLKGKLALPKKIFLPEAFQYILNPIFFIAIISTLFLCSLEQPFIFLAFLVLLLPILLTQRGRLIFIEVTQSNLILITALVAFLFKRRFDTWKVTEETRTFLNSKVLKEKNLI